MTKKISSLFLSILLAFSLSTSVFAADNTGVVKIQKESKVVSIGNNDIDSNYTETVVYTDRETKNKVIEVVTNSATHYVIVSPLVNIDVVAAEEGPNSGTIKGDQNDDGKDKTNIRRTYFTFAANLEEAKKIAQCEPITERSVSPEEMSPSQKKYFWHYSYVEEYTSGGYLYYHTHFTAPDVDYIKSSGLIIASTLSAVLAATGIITAPVGVVIGGIVSLAIVSYFHFTTNPDGSLDLEKRYLDLNVNDNMVKPGEKLGTARAGTGDVRTYYWPSNQPGFGL